MADLEINAPSLYSLAMANDKAQGMKSAYELALERLESQGIERPDAGSLTDADRAKIADIRSRAEAKIAQLEISHQQSLQKVTDPLAREKEEEEYRIERRRIEEARDAEIERFRRG